jgi:hypothetical protein
MNDFEEKKNKKCRTSTLIFSPIIDVKCRPNIANITEKTLYSKPYGTLILSITVMIMVSSPGRRHYSKTLLRKVS